MAGGGRLSLYMLLGIALLFPAVAIILVQAYYSLSVEAEETRGKALAAADTLILLADARATSDLSALRLLSRSRYLRDGEVAAGARRAQEAVEMLPGWRAVVLADRAAGEILFEATAESVTFGGQVDTDLLPTSPVPQIGDVEREGRHCPCVHLHVGIPRNDSLRLTAIVDPLIYQQILMQQLPEGSVAAIVDREGKFLARSIDYPDRVGTPATSYVREAVAQGGRGIYEGTTYENLTNYTAYATSEVTGWSSHVAIDNSLLDRPIRRANAVISFGVFVAIAAALSLFFLAAREILSRKQRESKVLELQRAEAVAQFTSTIVHDFRNVVTALGSGLSMIKRKTTDDAVLEHVALIEGSISRGTRLANQLLSLAHSGDSDIGAVELNATLDDMAYLLEQAAGREVELSIARHTCPLHVTANRDQLELALLNLVINARDATQGKGRITISATDCGGHVEIRVSDDGPGVPEKMRQTLFTPFTTSKPTGTGLGLAQVAGMARNAGGEVRFEDRGGAGATFVISLPKADDVSAAATAPPDAAQSALEL